MRKTNVTNRRNDEGIAGNADENSLDIVEKYRRNRLRAKGPYSILSLPKLKLSFNCRE